MDSNTSVYHAWHIAKGVGISFVVSFSAGWLTRELLTNKIDPANKAAAYILDLTLLVMLAVLAVLGAKRWRRNQLTPAAKRLLIVSMVFLIVFFVLGWTCDLTLK